MYAEDSFFTLSGFGQAGLLLVTLVLGVLTIWGVSSLLRGKKIWLKLLGSVISFVAFVWLSPQIYYAYYQLIFDDLPAQWVIGAPSVAEAVSYALFVGPMTLSAHGQGVLFWATLTATLVRR